MNMFRRRRWPRVPIMAGAAAVVAAGSWLLVQSIGGDPRDADASPPLSNDARRQADNPTERDLETPANALGAFGQPRNATERGGGAPTGGLASPNQQERQREIAQAGDHLRPDETDEATGSERAGATGHESADSANAANSTPSSAPQRTASPRAIDGGAQARQELARGLEILDSDPVAARKILTSALQNGALPAEDDENVRMALAHLNDRLIFGRTAHPEDPFARTHKVKSGDSLTKIAKDLDLHVDWRFLLRVNGMRDARALRAGQDLKLITGPFHAIIDKSDYRLDLYLGEGDEQVFVRSFKVGLGEYDSTPAGMFRVGVKQENPAWTNPRDPREKYPPDDPDNPLGDHWLALVGVDEITQDFTGYGIHGTIEPDSIGRQQSMGCVRLLPDDVKLIYEVLMTDVSMVEIRN
jgi:hypothetical protein